MIQQPLNRILFGAAGTGKTFHCINHALSIIENKPLDVLEQEDRTVLKHVLINIKNKVKLSLSLSTKALAMKTL